MTLLRTTLALLLLIAAVLLAAGCTGQQSADPSINTMTTATSSVPSAVTTVPIMTTTIPCTFPGNGSEWIQIDPIDNAIKGNPIFFTGRTNIPAGKTLNIALYESAYHPHCKCCFDVLFISHVKVRQGDRCGNAFSLWFDSTNYPPQEYFVTVTSVDNESVVQSLIFSLEKNATPLMVQDEVVPESGSPKSSPLVLFIPADIRREDVQTILGTINGAPRAIIYSVREDIPGSSCSPLSPWCKGGKIFGTMYPALSGPNSTRFAIRFDTDSLDPGKYVFDLDVTCTDESATGWFNVTPERTGYP